ASHGLRFDVCGAQETLEDFRQRISNTPQEEDGEFVEHPKTSYSERWTIGVKGRSCGSIHSDFWKGTAAEIATCRYMAVYPVVGWWRKRRHLHRDASLARYSLIVSIQTDGEIVDIYTPVAQHIAASQSISSAVVA
ncbi:MAG: peptidase S8, partial [Desulfovibrio sp.]|nr:peptidase S8 [Desulfovibrio sp.]